MKNILLLIWIILIFSAEIFITILFICDTEITTIKQLKILKFIENSYYQNNFLSEKKYYVVLLLNNKNKTLTKEISYEEFLNLQNSNLFSLSYKEKISVLDYLYKKSIFLKIIISFIIISYLLTVLSINIFGLIKYRTEKKYEKHN